MTHVMDVDSILRSNEKIVVSQIGNMYTAKFDHGREFIGVGTSRDKAIKELQKKIDITYPCQSSASEIAGWRRSFILQRDGLYCRYCSREDSLTIDHIIERQCGGTNDLANLQVLCDTCNNRKSNGSLHQYRNYSINLKLTEEIVNTSKSFAELVKRSLKRIGISVDKIFINLDRRYFRVIYKNRPFHRKSVNMEEFKLNNRIIAIYHDMQRGIKPIAREITLQPI